MPKLILGILCGLNFGILAVATIIPLSFDDKRAAMLGAFLNRFANPDAFFVTDHYVGYPMMLVRLSVVQVEDLRVLLEQAWRMVAPKRLVRAHFPATEAV